MATMAAASALDLKMDVDCSASFSPFLKNELLDRHDDSNAADVYDRYYATDVNNKLFSCCYVCPQCGSSFDNEQSMTNHVALIHRSSPVDEAYAPPPSIRLCHETDHVSSTSGKIYGNGNISAAYRSKKSLKRAHANYRYGCKLCPRTFASSSMLNVHYTHTHRDKPQYDCEVCGRAFSVKRELATHRRLHDGQPTHTCAQCHKEFGTKQLLRKHELWHTGERTHVCPQCNKAFFQKGHLTQHLMIHAGGRNHACHLCPKTFIFKFDLNRHMKIHAERVHTASAASVSATTNSESPSHSSSDTALAIGRRRNSNSGGRKSLENGPSRQTPPIDFAEPGPEQPGPEPALNETTSTMDVAAANFDALLAHNAAAAAGPLNFYRHSFGAALTDADNVVVSHLAALKQIQAFNLHNFLAPLLQNFVYDKYNDEPATVGSVEKDSVEEEVVADTHHDASQLAANASIADADADADSDYDYDYDCDNDRPSPSVDSTCRCDDAKTAGTRQSDLAEKEAPLAPPSPKDNNTPMKNNVVAGGDDEECSRCTLLDARLVASQRRVLRLRQVLLERQAQWRALRCDVRRIARAAHCLSRTCRHYETMWRASNDNRVQQQQQQQPLKRMLNQSIRTL